MLKVPPPHPNADIIQPFQHIRRSSANNGTVDFRNVFGMRTVSDYGLDDKAIEVRSPAEAKGFFL
jgi:hypothetical protein